MAELKELREKTSIADDDELYIRDSATAVGSTWDAKVKAKRIMSAAQRTKLENVEADADKNVHVASASYATIGADVDAAEVILYSDRAGTTVESTDVQFNDIQRIKIHRYGSDLSPQNPNADDDAIDLDAFFHRALSEGLVEVLVQDYYGDFSLNTTVDATWVLEPISYANNVLDAYVYLVDGNIPTENTPSFKLSYRIPSRHVPVKGLEAVLDIQATESTEADAKAGTDDTEANASRMTPRRTKQAITEQTDDLVSKADLEGHENDLFYNAQGATAFLSAGTTYKVGAFTVCTDGTTQPGTGDGVDWSNIQDGNYRFALGRGRTDRDGNASFTLGDALDAADYPVGKVIHMQPWQPYQSKAYAKLTLLTAGVLVGTGNAAFVWFRATVDEVGNIEDGSDYWKITDFAPSQLDLDIPVDGVAGAMRTNMANAQLDTQGNDTAPDDFLGRFGAAWKKWSWSRFFSRIKKAILGDVGFLSDLRSPSDPYVFTSNYTYKGQANPGAKGEWNTNATPALNGGNVQITINFKDADKESAVSRWVAGNEFAFGDARFKILGSVYLISATLNQYSASVQLVGGAEPSDDSTAAPVLEADTPHRSEFVDVAFQDEAPSQSHQYIRSTGGLDKGTQWQLPLADIGTSKSEKRMATAGAVVKAIEQVGGYTETTLLSTSTNTFINSTWKQFDLGSGNDWTDYDELKLVLQRDGTKNRRIARFDTTELALTSTHTANTNSSLDDNAVANMIQRRNDLDGFLTVIMSKSSSGNRYVMMSYAQNTSEDDYLTIIGINY